LGAVAGVAINTLHAWSLFGASASLARLVATARRDALKRARRELKFLRTRLGRIIRDVRRKIEGDASRQDRFGPLLDLVLRVRHQEQRQRAHRGK
jgi:hypothetical protein